MCLSVSFEPPSEMSDKCLTKKTTLQQEHKPLGLALIFRKTIGWGARIRTWVCRYQKPMPYRLATPQP